MAWTATTDAVICGVVSERAVVAGSIPFDVHARKGVMVAYCGPSRTHRRVSHSQVARVTCLCIQTHVADVHTSAHYNLHTSIVSVMHVAPSCGSNFKSCTQLFSPLLVMPTSVTCQHRRCRRRRRREPQGVCLCACPVPCTRATCSYPRASTTAWHACAPRSSWTRCATSKHAIPPCPVGARRTRLSQSWQ